MNAREGSLLMASDCAQGRLNAGARFLLFLHAVESWLCPLLLICVLTVPFAKVQTASSTNEPVPVSYDVVITNGRIVDGSGNPWYRADIGIRDGHIAFIGRIDPSAAAHVIDAKGQVVAPGFIDVHTHVE